MFFFSYSILNLLSFCRRHTSDLCAQSCASVSWFRSLGGSRYRYRLWGDSPKNHGSGVLNDFQTFLQKFCVSMPEADVVLRGGSVVQPDSLANHKRHSLGFGLSYWLGGQSAAFALMQHFVSDLMHQRGKFLGGLHPGKQSDLPAKGQAFGGCDPL